MSKSEVHTLRAAAVIASSAVVLTAVMGCGDETAPSEPTGSGGGDATTTTGAAATPSQGTGGGAGVGAPGAGGAGGEVSTSSATAGGEDVTPGFLERPVGIAVDETSAYWLDLGCDGDGGVMKRPLAGGDAVMLGSGDFFDLEALALDDEYVYWVGGRTLKRAPIHGGATQTLRQVFDSMLAGSSLAVDDTSVFWTHYDGDDFLRMTLERVPLGDGEPAVLAVDEHVGSLASDGTSVFWANRYNGTVMKVDVDGGEPEMVASAQARPASIAVDDTSVYWATDTGVWRRPLTGGAPENLAPGWRATSLRVDGADVYWTTSGSVLRMPRDGGQVVELASEVERLTGLATNSTDAHWAVRAGSRFDACDPIGDLASTALDGGVPAGVPPPTNWLGNASPVTLAVDATAIYWIEPFYGVVMKELIDGGSQLTLASQQSPTSIAIDGTSVYWTNEHDGTVMKVPLDGGTPTPIAVAQVQPNGIAVTPTHVAWATWHGVWSMPIEGGTPTLLDDLSHSVSCGPSPGALATVGEDLYWMNGVGWSEECGSTVMTVPVAGGTPEEVADGQAHPQSVNPPGHQAFAVDATHVYWGHWGDEPQTGTLERAPLGGGPPETLLSGGVVSAITLDAEYVYVMYGAFNGDLQVMKVPLDGGPATLLAEPEPGVDYWTIAVDDTNVYWGAGEARAPK